jgi:Protein of unknown function (DUF3108)
MGPKPRGTVSIAAPIRPLSVMAVLVLTSVGYPMVVSAAEPWPAAVTARYKLRFNGIDVGKIEFTSKVGPKAYTLATTADVSVLMGAIKWHGTSHVSGAIGGDAPRPASYTFDWKQNSKIGHIRLGFAGPAVTAVTVEPPASTAPEVVALTDQHKKDVLDPLSGVMMMTRADAADPCARRVKIFDGKHRFDLVATYKRQTLIKSTKPGAPSSVGIVCRVMYEPIAGHKANKDSKTYAANRDVELVLRRLPDGNLIIPYSVTIPTAWGTGSMVTDRIDVTTSTAGQFALTD